MKAEKILRYLNEDAVSIINLIMILCKTKITDVSYKIEIECKFDGENWCLFDSDTKKIKIHVSPPTWFVDIEMDPADSPEIKIQKASAMEIRSRLVNALGHEPTEDDIFAFLMGTAMHEFMHASITRSGSIFNDLVARFPMKNPRPTKFQKEYYEKLVEKTFRFWFNCACDARIENIGKQLYNVASYFELGRLVDYAAATEPHESDIQNFGFAILDLGTIGRLPQYEISDRVKGAVKALTEQPIIGSTRTRDNIEDFICEPHPTISAKMFVSWFDIPEVHKFVEELFQEELEEKAEMAEALAQFLNSLPQEVKIKGRSAKGMSTPVPLSLPGSFASMFPDLGDDENESGSSSGSQGNAKDTSQVSNRSDGTGTGSGESTDENAESTETGTSGSKQGQDSEPEKENGDSDGTNGQSKGSESKGKEAEEGSEPKSEGESKESDSTKPGEDGNSNSDGSSDGSNNQSSGDGSPNNGMSSHTDKDSASQPREGRTFDENGNWNTHGDGSSKLDKAPLLQDDPKLRAAIDDKIADIRPKAKAVNAKKSKQNKKPDNKRITSKDVSEAGLIIDKSFKPHLIAPQKVIRMAKPLRTVLKRAFANEQEDDITGLKAGTLNSASLYKLGQKDLSVFKVHRLPTINTAVYYFLWDGSGSMYGAKQQESGFACATIEEAVRGLYPVKIVNFYTLMNGVVHHVVKDFDEKSKKNYSYSFASMRSFNGGNKDGFAIKCAVEELIKRNETNKFLYVLSDGAPSAYSSMEDGIKDVENAVAFARQNRIDVTAIFFGSQRERDREIDLYKRMYGKGHIISCEPDQIVNHLISIVKSNIHR